MLTPEKFTSLNVHVYFANSFKSAFVVLKDLYSEHSLHEHPANALNLSKPYVVLKDL